MDELTKVNHNDLVDPQAQRVVDFLREIGLPHENIIAWVFRGHNTCFSAATLQASTSLRELND